MKLFHRSKSVLGVDIGSHAIKVIELSGTASSPTVAKVGLVVVWPRRGMEVSYERALRELNRKLSISSRDAVVAVSAASEDSTVMRIMFMQHLSPNVPKEELKEAVKWEAVARELLPYPPEEALIDCHILREKTVEDVRGIEVLFISTHKEQVEHLVRILRHAGLRTIAVDVDFLASLRLIQKMEKFTKDESIAIIDIGASKTIVGILRDGALSFVHDIPIAGNHITAEIQRQLGISPQEAEEYKLSETLFLRSDWEGTDEGINPFPQVEDIPLEDGNLEEDMWNVAPTDSSLELENEVDLHEADWHVAPALEAVIDGREGLYTQLRRCFDFYESEYPQTLLSKMVILGGTSQLRYLDNFFASRFGIHVEKMNYLRHLNVPSKDELKEMQAKEPVFSTAAGLALKGLAVKG